MARIVGISGFMHSGKDSAGVALINAGWVRRSFADPLKECCAVATGVPLEVFHDQDLKNVPRDDLYGLTPRHVLQQIGTEGFRTLVSPDIWADGFLRFAKAFEGEGVFTCDVRFVNEAHAILKAGGTLIHIDRPGKEQPEFLHQSETEIPEVAKLAHYIVANDGTIEQLHQRILNCVEMAWGVA